MIEVELPDGTVLEVDAPDPQSAANAARTFLAQRAGPPVQPLDTTRSPPTNVTGYDAGDQAIPTAYPPAPTDPYRLNKLGVQGAGRGLAEAAGAPVDLVAGLMNLIGQGVNKAGGAMGVDPGLPRIERPFLGSDHIADTVGRVAEALGYTTEAPPETLREKVVYNTNRFGANAAATAGGVVRSAGEAAQTVPGVIQKLAEPYTKTPGKALTGDAAAAGGAGAAVSAIPEDMKNSPYGPLVETGAALVGGIGGATGAGVARAGANYAVEKGAEKLGVGARDGFSRADWDTAARAVQESASSPATAAANIEGYYADLLPHESPRSLPTTGAASNDVGVALLEKAHRTKDGKPFIEQDQRVNTAVRGQVDKTAPGDATPEPFLDRAASEADTAQFNARTADDAARRAANAEVTAAEQRAAEVEAQRRGATAPIAAARGQGPAASQRLDRAIVDEGYVPARTEKNRQFDEAPGREQQLPADPVIRAAQDVRRRNNALRPDQQIPGDLVRRLEALEPDIEMQGAPPPTNNPVDFARQIAERDPNMVVEGRMPVNTGGPGTVRGGDLADLRKYIRTAEDKARQQGNFDLADSLGQLRAAVNDTIMTAPGYAEANANYAQFAETYRPAPKDPMAQFTRDIDRDGSRAATPPSETAGRFIQSESPERTASLQRVIAEQQNPAAAQAAARDYLLADLAARNVIDARTGAIRPDVLRRWAHANDANLDLAPGFRAEVDDMLAQAQRGETLAGQAANDVRAARQRANIPDTVIQKNALSDLAGTDAVHAVQQIFGSKNPRAAIDDIIGRIGSDEAARNGLKASVREWLLEKATTSAVGKTTDQSNPISFQKLDDLFKKHEDVLGQIYTPEEMSALRRAHKMLAAGKNLDVNATSGSNTAEKASNAMRMLEAGLKAKFGMLKGGGIMRTLKLVASTFPSNDAAVQQIIGRMWTDPDVAVHLLTRPLKEIDTPDWNKRLSQLLALEEGARATTETKERKQ